jgi:uncharacterized protein
MRIALTGATGFIGRPLADHLATRGHDLVLLGRRPPASLPPRARTARFLAGEAVEPSALEGLDAVVHLAGEPLDQRWTAAAKERILHSRVAGTQAMVAAAKSAKVSTFVCGSAVGYYGPHGAEALTEASPPGDDFLAQVCRAWEQAALAAEDAGLRTVRVRIGLVLHPDGGVLKKLLLPFRLGLGGSLGSGEQYMSWIHREDLLALFAHLLEAPEATGPFNATAPEPATNLAFSRTLAHVLGRPAFTRTPSFALRWALGELADAALNGQRALPARAQQTGFTFQHPSLEPALRALLVGAGVTR